MHKIKSYDEFITESKVNESEKAIIGKYNYKGKTYDLWTDDEHNLWIVVNGRTIEINNEAEKPEGKSKGNPVNEAAQFEIDNEGETVTIKVTDGEIVVGNIYDNEGEPMQGYVSFMTWPNARQQGYMTVKISELRELFAKFNDVAWNDWSNNPGEKIILK